ncbi:DoxX family protein [Bacterioplanoides sp.]|uniref:HvfX family Cu-binding RiPP maturation protein n=1 Tax=Bacterioplanoides sp. TaxID=2066072 RepID=UPI003B595946
MSIQSLAHWVHDQLDVAKSIDFVGPLALRIYLFFPFWMAGTNKLAGFDSTVAWFGNPDWGLGLPAPELLAFLATWTEILGAVFLLIGFATRYITIPLMVTMIVAIFAVHWDHGWYAIAQSTDPEVADRLNRAKDILRENSNYDWITAKGGFVILNNGIEFAVTYLVMLLVLFFNGAGKYLSVDHWIKAKFRPED